MLVKILADSVLEAVYKYSKKIEHYIDFWEWLTY